LTARMGLDQPIAVQVWRFFSSAARGDLGVDVWSKRPVLDQILEAFPQTLLLGAVALGWALALGVTLGVLAVVYRGTAIDRGLGLMSVSFISVPSFVVSIYLLLIFAVWLQFLPALAIGIGWVGYLARMVRASMLEIMGSNHIRTARAFGLPETRVVTRYALRLAIVPTLSVIAVGLGGILSSAVFVETVFSRPGIGTLITGAVFKRNYPVVMGTVLFTTAFYLLVITCADLLIAKLDPRVRDALAR